MGRLYHPPRRARCRGILASGFVDHEPREGIAGVWLSDGVWHNCGTVPPAEFDPDPADVVFVFDVPDGTAAGYEVLYEAPGPGYREWCFPAAVLGPFLVGVSHWHGDRPLTEADIE